jgi:nucleotide-binding universal stress UspA family protein
MPQPKRPPASGAYASIMVPMSLDSEAEGLAKLATSLADRFKSRLIGVAAMPVLAPLYFESAIEGVASIIEIEERRAADDIAKVESVFRRVVGTRNNVEWRHALSFPLDHVLEQARAADLIVASRSLRQEGPSMPKSADGGDLVMGAGRPVLFVPPRIDFLSAKRIVVGWKDSREARRAVWDSLPLLKGAQEVSVVSIDSQEQAAKDVSAYLGCHGVESSVITRAESTKSVADELIRIAQQEGADLIVCGAYGHSRAREWIFGGVTRDLLDHSPLCCLMAH